MPNPAIGRREWLITIEENSDTGVENPAGESSASDRDWTKGNLLTNVLLLAWPVMISTTFQMAGPTIDMIWVGRLGAASIAGVGVAGMAVQLVTGLMTGITTGARAMIARFWGAGDTEGANHVARQAFFISAAFSVIMATVGIFLTELIMGLFGLEPEVIAQGAAYMRIMFVGAMAMSFLVMTGGIMQASGDTVAPMRITVVTRLFHVALAPFLIFGWWIFPRLGVSGAAMTNVISQSLGTAVILWYLFTGRTRLRLTLSDFRVDLNVIWRMVKIGIPASLTGIQYQFGGLVLLRIIAPFGTLAVAAHTVVQRAEMLVFTPSGGFGMAAGVLAGQNLGANKPERAMRSAWIAIALVEGVMLIGAAVTFLWADSIVGLFSSDPALIELSSIFLKIAIVSFFGMGVCAVIFNCLNHVGDTVPPLVIFVLAVWLIELPMAYFLPKVTDLGIYAVRWAIVAHLTFAAAGYLVYWRRGSWKHKMV